MSVPLYASFLYSPVIANRDHRSASFSEIQHRSQRSGNVIFCTLYGCVHIKSFCKVRCNGTGKCAAGSMCIRIINTFSVEPTIIAVTIKQVICIIQLMSALAENCAVVCITDFSLQPRSYHLLSGSPFPPELLLLEYSVSEHWQLEEDVSLKFRLPLH